MAYHRDGDFLGAAVVEAPSVFQAEMKAAAAGLDPGFECEGLELDPPSRNRIPRDMIGRALNRGELAWLGRALAPIKKPAAASVRRTAKEKRAARS